jgi:antirestriction protein ArdC
LSRGLLVRARMSVPLLIGITPEVREDHAAYIASWLKALPDDKRLIFTAAAHAQRAADYLHALQAVRIKEERAAA